MAGASRLQQADPWVLHSDPLKTVVHPEGFEPSTF